MNQIAKQQQQSKSSGGSSKVYYTGNGSLGWPVPGRTTVSSGFVTRTSPITGRTESHSGLDIPAPYGTAIVAAEAGKVTYSGWVWEYHYHRPWWWIEYIVRTQFLSGCKSRTGCQPRSDRSKMRQYWLVYRESLSFLRIEKWRVCKSQKLLIRNKEQTG